MLPQATLANFYQRYADSPEYAGQWGEDADKNGVLDSGEDFNGNGELDPVVGMMLATYRYNMTEFGYGIGSSGTGRQVKGTLSGVAMDYTKFDWRPGDTL